MHTFLGLKLVAIQRMTDRTLAALRLPLETVTVVHVDRAYFVHRIHPQAGFYA